jgi:hypothetical protein
MEDRAKMLAFVAEEATRCQLCGTAQWEWDEDQFAYAPIEQHCRGCYLKRMAEDDSGSSLPGTTVNLIPTDSPEYRRLQSRLAENAEERRRGR